MRGRESRAGWDREEEESGSEGVGPTVFPGMNTGVWCLERGFTASPSPLNLLQSLFIVPNYSGYCLLRIYTRIFTL